MNVIRFSDLCANGSAKGQRVFIRADLNVPPATSPRTPASAPLFLAFRWRWTRALP